VTGHVAFVGAGPGAADLLTLRAAQRIAEADIVIWAASLVHEDVLQHVRPGAVVVNSAEHSLEGITSHYERAAREGLRVARIHSGDPALWGGTQEQMELCRTLGLEIEVVPGVSSFSAVAALVQRELTVPEVAQSVVLTRLEGGKTPMPPGETVRGFASHGTTMALFLSAARTKQLQDELLAAGSYDEDTPCVVAYAATWPDELVFECRLGDLAEKVKEHKLYKHTLVLVGPALGSGGTRSHLYHPGHFHEHRKVEDQAARAALRQRRRPVRERPA
jgi:precorrin-4/cobalt-precorrin-4 C11-methyltransferase